LFCWIEMMGVASRKLHSRQRIPIKRVIHCPVSIEVEIAEKHGVAKPQLAAANASGAAASARAVFAINHRQIELRTDTIVEIIADERLRVETVEVFGIGISPVMAVRLEGVEIGIL